MSERNGYYFEHGEECWYKNGELHRDNGPAVIRNGIEIWYKEGKIHREGGPALIDGMYFEWRIDGKLHCEDGPAVVYNGKPEFWFKGERVTKSVIKKIVELKNENKKLMLELCDPVLQTALLFGDRQTITSNN